MTQSSAERVLELGRAPVSPETIQEIVHLAPECLPVAQRVLKSLAKRPGWPIALAALSPTTRIEFEHTLALSQSAWLDARDALQEQEERARNLAAVEESARERGIRHLVHFTCSDNLKSIIQNGLLSRRTLSGSKYDYVYSDDVRLDGKLDYVSLSISFPNYKMFYMCRKTMQNKVWAVLELRPEILWTHECYFLHDNAASSRVTQDHELAPNSSLAFDAMFGNSSGNSRSAKLPACLTSNPQAEVLALCPITPSYIMAICVEDTAAKAAIEADMPSHVTVRVEPSYFSYRQDWARWQKSEPADDMPWDPGDTPF